MEAVLAHAPAENEVLLHDAASGNWLYFTEPLEIVLAPTAGEVMDALRYVEAAVARRGLYAAGMLAYEAASGCDPALAVRRDADFPLLWFGLYREPATVILPGRPPAEAPPMAWKADTSLVEYGHHFARIKCHIADGDVYQVNYTYRLLAPFSGRPWPFFLRMLAAQKPQFAAYLDAPPWIVCSASPELFWQLDGDLVVSQPMKGTAPRGLSAAQDREQAAALQASEKNRAENLMIVDMVRNDLGRIAETGSVRVPRLFSVERYPTVWQMTSSVTARTNASPAAIMQALFPAASITGAPKNRSMRVIHELERAPRRLYSGTIGYLAPGRRAQFSVAIRTLLLNRQTQQAEYGVGGGIVWDSDVDQEQAECQTKARILTVSLPEFSLLETLRWTPQEGYFLLAYHLARLAASAAYFDYAFELQTVEAALQGLVHSLPATPHKVRLLIGADGKPALQAETIPEMWDRTPRAVALATVPVDRSNVFLYHKTTRRQVYREALATRAGYDDVIMVNEQGEVTESTIANVVAEIDGMLCTPPVSCGLLPGTYRQWLLDQKAVRERSISAAELLASPRVYLINSVRGMVPVLVEA